MTQTDAPAKPAQNKPAANPPTTTADSAPKTDVAVAPTVRHNMFDGVLSADTEAKLHTISDDLMQQIRAAKDKDTTLADAKTTLTQKLESMAKVVFDDFDNDNPGHVPSDNISKAAVENKFDKAIDNFLPPATPLFGFFNKIAKSAVHLFVGRLPTSATNPDCISKSATLKEFNGFIETKVSNFIDKADIVKDGVLNIKDYDAFKAQSEQSNSHFFTDVTGAFNFTPANTNAKQDTSQNNAVTPKKSCAKQIAIGS